MRGIEDTSVLGVGLQSGVGQLGVGYLGVRGESLDTDQLSLDLQFAADKTLTARKGPTPVFIRSSGDNRGTTYFGPSSINVVYSYFGDFDVDVVQIPAAANVNGRLVWQNGDTQFYYTGSAWALAHDGNLISTSAPTSAFRPDGANWRGTAAVVTATGEFGIVRAANNEPRFDHDPVTLACKGLLIEESRTNSITGSNAFNTWTLASCTVAASSVVTPEGTADAWKVVEDILLASHSATRPFAPVSGTTYTASAWIKSAENGFAFVGLTGGGFAATFISVNLSTGAVSTAVGTPIGGASAAYSNGWWRVSFSLAATSSLSSVVDIRLSRDGIWANRSYLGNGVNGMYCYGAQVEAGSFPTSYIPTTTASLARSADVCSITGSDFTGFYNQSEGSFACNYSIPAGFTGNRYAAAIEDPAGGLINAYTFRNTNSGLNFINTGGYTSTIGAITTTLDKHIIAYSGTSEFVYCKNSVIGSNIGSGTRDPSLLNRMGIGTLEASNSFALNGHIASIRYFKKRLANAKLQQLTT